MFYSFRLATLACSVSMLAGTGLAAEEEPATARAQSVMARLPLRFEANQGQLGPEVRYSARAGGYTLLLTDRGPSLVVKGARVDVSLQNANRAAQLEPLGRVPGRTDYFLGKPERWRTDIPVFERVRYRGVYPGVDVVYYGNQSQLEYDFVLQPGADPAAIRMKFGREARLSVTPEGDLSVELRGARVVQKRPYIYQEDPKTSARTEIAGGYRLLRGNRVGLRVDGYDRRRNLVIDPVITYCTYLGGQTADQINAVKLMPGGRLYIAGQTDAGQIPYVDGAYNNGNSGSTDVFVSIIDLSRMQLSYSSYLGGSNADIALAMDVDSQGIVYLTGTTTSTNFPLAGSAFQSTGAASGVDAFVVKLDPSQYGADALAYSSYLGGASGNDSGNGIAVGPDGMIYVIGTTLATDFPVTPTAYQAVLWGSQDSFLCKIDPNAGALAYSTFLGGELQDDGRSILVGQDGRVYFATSTLSQYFPLAGYAYSGGPAGGEDIIVGIMDMNQSGDQSLVYATYFGGSGNEEVRNLAFDGQGNVVFTGYTLSTDFPVTPDALQNVNNGGGDAFVAVLNPTIPFQYGLVYSTYLGGTGGDVGYDVMADPSGDLYVTGYTLSPDFPVAGSVPQAQWGGGTNLFLTRLKPGVAGRGGLQFSTYIGQTGTYVASGMALGPDGAIYLVGRGNIGLPSSATALQGGYAGGVSDGFVLVLNQ